MQEFASCVTTADRFDQVAQAVAQDCVATLLAYLAGRIDRATQRATAAALEVHVCDHMSPCLRAVHAADH